MIRRHGELPRLVLLGADFVATAAALLAAYWLRVESGLVPLEGRTEVLPARYAAAFPVATALLLVSTALAGLYGRDALVRVPPVRDLLRLVLFDGLLLGTIALLYWDEFQYSRLAIGMTAALRAPLVAALRAPALRIIGGLRGGARFTTRVAVVGGGGPARRLAAALEANPWAGVEVTLHLRRGDEQSPWTRATEPADLAELFERLSRQECDEVYVALPAAAGGELPSLLVDLDQLPVNVRLVPDLGDVLVLNPAADVLSGVPVVALRERPLFGVRRVVKRTFDVVLALVLLVLLAPLLLAIAVAVRLESRGPALFSQERMGLDGRPFQILKFRTMREDAEAATGPVFAARDDPRVTGVGRVLRRLSLDELPQLWNVLRGEMSLVGPRPERAAFIEDFRRRFPAYMQRHAVKSGMTGWAQVHGLRGDSSIEDRLRMDLEYVDRWSLLLDVEILGRTAVHVLVGRNAY